MAIDQALIGQATAQLMDELEQYGADAEIELVTIVVAVGRGSDGGTIHYKWNGPGHPRVWQARGLLDTLLRILDRHSE